MRLSDFFQSSETGCRTHSWTLVGQDPAMASMDTLASALADKIIEHQCRGCPHLYFAWKQRIDGGPPPSGVSKAALNVFIEATFGLPSNPTPIPQDHLEGFVGQMLWYFLCLEISAEDVVRIESPGFKTTDPGGDGLVIHRTPAGHLMFRLREMKKFAQERGNVVSTVNVAYNQLNSRATEYLARYTATGQEISDVELADFYGQLVELWIDARPEASAGVSITTSSRHVSLQCFDAFGDHFPRFIDPIRLRGMLSAVEDFSLFCCKVRDFVWTGL